MSDFKSNNCVLRKIYCGTGAVPKGIEYYRKGTGYECLRKGFGVADWTHRKKSLPKNSLQQIMYVGAVYEKNFKKYKINTIPALIKKMKTLTAPAKRTLLTKICKKSNGTVDHKVLNSVILFLHKRGVGRLPNCKITRE